MRDHGLRLTLVRHGETTGQSSIRYYGATDVPLSALGEEQMRRTGAALAHESFDAVYSSRLCRSRRSAALVASRPLQGVAIAAFDEVHFGRWEGLTREEIAACDPEEFRRWQDDPERFVYPEGECRRAFQRRVAAGLREILDGTPHRKLLAVVHRGVIASALTELLGLTQAQRRALAIDLGSIHVLVRRESGWVPERLNATEHLAGLPSTP